MTFNGKQIESLYRSPEFKIWVDRMKSPMLWAFPELVINPTNKVWYPYVLMFFRIWMYGLVFHHLTELKSIVEVIPFIK